MCLPALIAGADGIVSGCAQAIPEPYVEVSDKYIETFNDIPGGSGKGTRIRVIFTKIFSNKVLIGGMTAGISR